MGIFEIWLKEVALSLGLQRVSLGVLAPSRCHFIISECPRMPSRNLPHALYAVCPSVVICRCRTRGHDCAWPRGMRALNGEMRFELYGANLEAHICKSFDRGYLKFDNNP